MDSMYGYYGPHDYADPFASSSVAVGTGGIAGFILAFLLLFYLAMFAYVIVAYVLQSVSLYTIAKRRGIRHAWLAWIPVGSLWIIGSISDQYQYVVKGKVRNRRKIMLGLAIGSFFAFIPMVISMVGTLIAGFGYASVAENTMFGVSLVIMLLTWLAITVLEIVLIVYLYVAMYDVFASCEPGNATLYLVLSVLLGVVQPFFMFACRNKDLGMPPRKAEKPAPQVEQLPAVEAPVVEETPTQGASAEEAPAKETEE